MYLINEVVEMHVNVPITRDQQKKLDILEHWDFSRVLEVGVREKLFTAEEAVEMLSEYRKWQAVCVLVPNEEHPMTGAVDPMWHAHILCTENYHDFCQAVHGKYQHHRPAMFNEDREVLRLAFNKTIEAMRRFFGTPNPQYWLAVSTCTCGWC